MNRAREKLVNKDPGEKEEIRLRSEEVRLPGGLWWSENIFVARICLETS